MDVVHPPVASRKRGCLFYVKRGLKWVGILLVALIILGVVYQTIATENDKRAFPPPGQLYDVNGHKMHLYCTGEGSPTIILEAGGISFSSEWYWVQQELSQTNRVCSYDRAGNGWSEPGPASRDPLRVVQELKTLLAQATIPGPYVLVGHSYGGVINRVYAHQYPDDVIGITLVDTAFVLPQFNDRSEYDQWKRENDLLQAALWGLVQTGIYRFMVADAVRGWGYPPEAGSELAALRSTRQAFDVYYAEGIAARWELDQQSRAAENLGSLPLMILWATILPPTSPSEQAHYRTLQQDVAGFSLNSAVRYVEGADHGSIIGSEQYARQVSDAVLDVIESADTGQPLAQ